MTQGIGHGIQIDLLKQRIDRLGTHLGHELVGIAVIERLVALRQRAHDVQILFLRKGLQPFHTLLGGSTGVDYHIALVIDDRLQLLGRDTQQIADLRGQGAEIPDMHHRHHQRNVAHALAAHLFLGHFHAATVADDALVTDTLVLTAMALIVLDRTKDTLTEQTVTLRLIRTIVNCFRFQNLTAGVL